MSLSYPTAFDLSRRSQTFSRFPLLEHFELTDTSNLALPELAQTRARTTLRSLCLSPLRTISRCNNTYESFIVSLPAFSNLERIEIPMPTFLDETTVYEGYLAIFTAIATSCPKLKYLSLFFCWETHPEFLRIVLQGGARILGSGCSRLQYFAISCNPQHISLISQDQMHKLIPSLTSIFMNHRSNPELEFSQELTSGFPDFILREGGHPTSLSCPTGDPSRLFQVEKGAS